MSVFIFSILTRNLAKNVLGMEIWMIFFFAQLFVKFVARDAGLHLTTKGDIKLMKNAGKFIIFMQLFFPSYQFLFFQRRLKIIWVKSDGNIQIIYT